MLAGLADDHAPVLLGNPPPDVPGGERQADRACTAECAEAGHRGRRLALRAVVTAVTVAVLVVAVIVMTLAVIVIVLVLVVAALVGSCRLVLLR